MADRSGNRDRTRAPRRVLGRAWEARRPRWPLWRRGVWRVLAASHVQRLRDDLALATPPPGLDAVLPGIHQETFLEIQKRMVADHLDQAESAMSPVTPLRLLRDWYSGAALEQTWLSIHRASEALLLIQPAASLAAEFVDLQAAFETNIKATDVRHSSLAHALEEVRKILLVDQQPHLVTAVRRSKLRAARYAANVASDTAHEAVRKWRNVLIIAGVILGVLGMALAVVHAFVPSFLSLVPTGDVKQTGDAVELWEVELVGAVGGALAAVLALNRFSGFTDPSGLPTTQALVRIPTAIVTSLLGVVVMQTAALNTLQPQGNGTTLLAYAFIFGYAQEPLLRMLDRQAAKVLDPARSKDEPATPSTPSNGGTSANVNINIAGDTPTAR